MHPSRRVRMSALVLVALVALAVAAPSSAQTYADALRSAQLSQAALTRSPRMLGLGRMELVMADEHTRITMWDFAGNPTGVADADSGSTLEVRPRTAASSQLRDRIEDPAGGVRQIFAARDAGMGFEAWRRAGDSTAYGFEGEVANLRVDDPYTESIEVRSALQMPRVQGVLTGKMPYVLKDRMRFALRVQAGQESHTDQYRDVRTDASGIWIDRDGVQRDAPDTFTPDDRTDDQLGGGGALSFAFGRALRVAAGYDFLQHKLRDRNEGDRYLSGVDENRPVHSGQFSAVGRLGSHLEYGADARTWTSSSQANWMYTISAGVGGIPLASRGKLYERDEEGTTFRSRARWTAGALEIGAGLNTDYGKVHRIVPGVDDLTSFNHFRNSLLSRSSADTLTVPDSLYDRTLDQHAWEASGGIAWTRLPHHARAGLEFHAWRDVVSSDVGGMGPRAVGWDVRSGLEVSLNPIVDVRGGYILRRDDLDDLTASNEYLTHSMTLGLGLKPARAIWTVDVGYVLDLVQADFGDPSGIRGNRQRLAAQMRWDF
jgi:hypothetical protein